MAAKTISDEELAKHATAADAWLAIDGDVYDVSKFARLHPGGAKVLEYVAGRDATTEFYELHRKDTLSKYGRLRVGRLASAGPSGDPNASKVTDVPFAEIPAFQGQHSPFYNETHRRFLEATRRFVDEKLMPVANDMDLRGEHPDLEFRQMLGSSGFLACRLGPGRWLKEAEGMGIALPGGVKAAEFDYFHEMILIQELARVGLPGFIDACGGGWMISAPAIFNFGSDELRSRVMKDVLLGNKWTCLAVSEPFAGSDVANVKTTAVPTPDGQHYIVNGVKKWITEGMWSDYFVTAVRTGTGGAKGISMLLVEREQGVETKQIKTTYSTTAGTALVIIDDAKVSRSNLFGAEGDGFRQIMYNFNHERWVIVNNVVGLMRAALVDALLWAKQRRIFGKSLIDQPVIRNKLAAAASSVESCQAYIEALTYDMAKAEGGPLGPRMAGPIAMLKYQATRSAWLVADHTVQIFGGRGITRTGMGSRVEGLKNFAKYGAVYGGSEEIMADLAVKQALKNFPQHAKL